MVATSISDRERIAEFHVLRDNSRAVLFDRYSLSVFPLLDEPAQVIATILENSRALPDSSPVWSSIASILNNFSATDLTPLLSGVSKVGDVDKFARLNTVAPGRYLHKLAINVAQECNLACTYCYANSGLYGSAIGELVTEDEIEKIILRFAERFDLIDSVQFMGGEPSMNAKAIQRAGEVFERLVDDGQLVALPEFKLVTNGLRFTRRFLETAVRNRIALTVSLDGPREVHDFARVGRNGRGSYDRVRQNIHTVQELGLSIGFEATFSRAHLIHNIRLIDLCQWFFDEFGLRVLHAPPMSENKYADNALGLSNEEKMREYCSVTEWGIDNLLERGEYLLHGFTHRILENLEKRLKNRHICPAGNSQLSVSSSGVISPCWMFTDDDRFSMGSVDDPHLLDESHLSILRELDRYELHSHPDCRSCLIQPVCFGCKGGDYLTTGSLAGKTNCDFMRAMVATLLLRLAFRPDVSDDRSTYYDRESSGERIWGSLRPVVPFTSGANGLIPLTPIT